MGVLRKLHGLGLGRELLLLAFMWLVGGLLLVSLIDLNGQADRARKRELVLVQLREASVPEAWIAFTSHPPDRLVTASRIAALERQMHASASRLEALGDGRYAPAIDASIAGALGWTRIAAALSADGNLSGAIALFDQSHLPGGRGRGFTNILDRANLAYQTEGDTASDRANIVSVVLALVVLLAFSLALVRSTRARRRAEALSGDKQVLLEQSRVEASTDALTGMANRRKLFEDSARLLRELPPAAASRSASSTSTGSRTTTTRSAIRPATRCSNTSGTGSSKRYVAAPTPTAWEATSSAWSPTPRTPRGCLPRPRRR